MRPGSNTSSSKGTPMSAAPTELGKMDDEALAMEAVNGNASAFEELVRRYQDRVYSMLVQFCGSKTEAEDLAQETFLKAYRALANFKRDSKFYTWLFRIAVNTGISRGRKVSRQRKHEGVSLDAPVDGGKSDDGESATTGSMATAKNGASPEGEVSRKEIQERVRAGLEQLNPEYRSVVLLRDMEGLDYGAIADALDISLAAVKSRLHRARIQLAKILRDLRPEGREGQVHA